MTIWQYYLREFVCVNYRHLGPGARGKAARNGRARGGSTELAALKRYVFHDSMRAPVRRCSAVRFFAKVALSPQRCRKKIFLATPQARESFF